MRGHDLLSSPFFDGPSNVLIVSGGPISRSFTVKTSQVTRPAQLEVDLLLQNIDDHTPYGTSSTTFLKAYLTVYVMTETAVLRNRRHPVSQSKIHFYHAREVHRNGAFQPSSQNDGYVQPLNSFFASMHTHHLALKHTTERTCYSRSSGDG